MKRLFACLLLLYAISGWAANPSYEDFWTNHFFRVGNQLRLRFTPTNFNSIIVTNNITLGTNTLYAIAPGANITFTTNGLVITISAGASSAATLADLVFTNDGTNIRVVNKELNRFLVLNPTNTTGAGSGLAITNKLPRISLYETNGGNQWDWHVTGLGANKYQRASDNYSLTMDTNGQITIIGVRLPTSTVLLSLNTNDDPVFSFPPVFMIDQGGDIVMLNRVRMGFPTTNGLSNGSLQGWASTNGTNFFWTSLLFQQASSNLSNWATVSTNLVLFRGDEVWTNGNNRVQPISAVAHSLLFGVNAGSAEALSGSSAIFYLGPSAGGSQLLTNSSSIYNLGDGAGSQQHLVSASKIFNFANTSGQAQKITNSSDVVNIGQNAGNGQRITNSPNAAVFNIGDNAGGSQSLLAIVDLYNYGFQAGKSQLLLGDGFATSDLYNYGSTAGQNQVLTNAQNIYNIGHEAGSGQRLTNAWEVYNIGHEAGKDMRANGISNVFNFGEGASNAITRSFTFGGTNGAYSYYFPGSNIFLRNVHYRFPTTNNLTGLLQGLATTDGTNLFWTVFAGSGLTTNANQFLGAPLSIKDGASVTNLTNYSVFTVASNGLIIFGPDTTNALSATGQIMTWTNGGRSADFHIVNKNGKFAALQITEGNHAMILADVGGDVYFGPNNNGSGTILITPSTMIPVVSNTVHLGEVTRPYIDAYLSHALVLSNNNIYSLAAGANTTFTTNGSILTIASAGGAGGSLTTNENQFAGAPLSIKNGAVVTNLTNFGVFTFAVDPLGNKYQVTTANDLASLFFQGGQSSFNINSNGMFSHAIATVNTNVGFLVYFGADGQHIFEVQTNGLVRLTSDAGKQYDFSPSDTGLSIYHVGQQASLNLNTNGQITIATATVGTNSAFQIYDANNGRLRVDIRTNAQSLWNATSPVDNYTNAILRLNTTAEYSFSPAIRFENRTNWYGDISSWATLRRFQSENSASDFGNPDLPNHVVIAYSQVDSNELNTFNIVLENSSDDGTYGGRAEMHSYSDIAGGASARYKGLLNLSANNSASSVIADLEADTTTGARLNLQGIIGQTQRPLVIANNVGNLAIVTTNGLFWLRGAMTLTNRPGDETPWLRLNETNGRGYTEFTVTNSLATNRLVWWLGSNTVAASQYLKIHSTTISAGINNIILTNDEAVTQAQLNNASNVLRTDVGNLQGMTNLWVLELNGVATNLSTYSGSAALTVIPLPGIGTNSFQIQNTNSVVITFQNSNDVLVTSNLYVKGSISNESLTASTILSANTGKTISSVANGTGMLTNNGSGVFGYMAIPASGSGTNTLWQTNQVTLGSAGTANMGFGITGAITAGVLTFGVNSPVLTTETNWTFDGNNVYTTHYTNQANTRISIGTNAPFSDAKLHIENGYDGGGGSSPMFIGTKEGQEVVRVTTNGSLRFTTPTVGFSEMAVSPDVKTNNMLFLPTNAMAGPLASVNVNNGTNQLMVVPLTNGQYLTFNGTSLVASNLPPSGGASETNWTQGTTNLYVTFFSNINHRLAIGTNQFDTITRESRPDGAFVTHLGNNGDKTYLAVRIVPTNSYFLDSVDLWLSKLGTPNYKIQVSIWIDDTSGTLPFYPITPEYTIYTTNLASTATNHLAGSFGLFLTAGQKYWIVCRADGQTTANPSQAAYWSGSSITTGVSASGTAGPYTSGTIDFTYRLNAFPLPELAIDSSVFPTNPFVTLTRSNVQFGITKTDGDRIGGEGAHTMGVSVSGSEVKMVAIPDDPMLTLSWRQTNVTWLRPQAPAGTVPFVLGTGQGQASGLILSVNDSMSNLFSLTYGGKIYSSGGMATNYAAYPNIITNLALNTYYTNTDQRATVRAFVWLAPSTTNAAEVGLYIGANGTGTWNETNFIVTAGAGVVSSNRYMIAADIQPGYRFILTNLSVAPATAALTAGASQWTKW